MELGVNPFKPYGMSHDIKWTSPFPILGLSGGIFHFYSKFKTNLFANSGEPEQTSHFGTFDMVLHCLLMSHKKGR